MKIFTCYLLAQYLVMAHILRTKTGYLSFSEDLELKRLRSMMYMIDEELDRRRDVGGRNVGVWPAARVLISERMIVKTLEVNEMLDGGIPYELMGYDVFYGKWDDQFKKPMGYFCEWIDLMLEGRIEENKDKDAPMRCLQHLLVDLVQFLDGKNAYVTRSAGDMKCRRSHVDCDCSAEKCGGPGNINVALKERQESRWYDAGLWAFNGRKPVRPDHEKYDPSSDNKITLDEVKRMTHTVDLV